MDGAEALAILRRTGAEREGHFLLTSGLHSNHFFLSAPLTQSPEETERIARGLAEPFRDAFIETVVGPAMGGVVLGYEVARQLALQDGGRPRAIYTEKTADGRMALRRGWTLRPGERTLVVEDAISTGGSVRKTLEAIRPSGCTVVSVAAIADRTGGTLDLGVPFRALVTTKPPLWTVDACPLCADRVPLVRPKA